MLASAQMQRTFLVIVNLAAFLVAHSARGTVIAAGSEPPL